MKKTIIFFMMILICVLLYSCNGYNNLMYDHLSDLNNYISVTGTIENIVFFDADWNELNWDLSDDDIPDLYEHLCIYIKFYSEDDYLQFTGTSNIPENFEYQSVSIMFDMIKTNIEILNENSFFKESMIDEEVSIVTSNWIYMDTNFFQIVGLSFEEISYLDPEEGLNNYSTYMEDNSSLF